MATVTRPTRPKQRQLTLSVTIDGTPYAVAPLAIDPAIGFRAWRFEKQAGDGEIYDLHVDRYGVACQCLGYERWGRCKHLHAVSMLADMFRMQPATRPAAEPTANGRRSVVLVPCPHCAGNMESEDGCGCDYCAGRGYVPAESVPTPPASQPIPDEEVPF